MKIKEPNPLDFLGIRRLNIPPDHFEYILLPYVYNIEQSIEKWIVENLKGRFYVGKSLSINDNNQIDRVFKVGFEEHKELTYFTLACPLLKYK